MNCGQMKEYLNEYVDGFLPEEMIEQVDAHLLQCVDCRKKADALLLLREDIRALKIADTSDFAFDIARAKAPVALPLRKRRWVQALSTAAACVVLVVGVLAVTQSGYQSLPDTEGENVGQTGRVTENKTQEDTRLRAAEVPEEKMEFHVPEDADKYTYYSSYSTSTKNDKQSFSGQTIHDVAVPTPEVPITVAETPGDLNVSADAEAEPASGGAAGAAPAATYEKRVVTLEIAPESREAFMAFLAGGGLTAYGGETVMDASVLESLLTVEGVTLVSDVTVAAESNLYQGKIVLVY